MTRIDARLDDVLADLMAGLAPLGTEEATPASALGRRVVAAVPCPQDLPDRDRSAMDGYAVRGEDVQGASGQNPVELQVLGTMLAGDTGQTLTVGRGQAVRTATGAALPEGADTVIRSELVEEDAASIRVADSVPRFKDVRRRGEEARRGDELLPSGTVLGSAQVAALSGLGVTAVTIPRQARVALLMTGTEVSTGEVSDVLGPALTVLLSGPQATVVAANTVTDDTKELEEALARLAGKSDLVITTGGASVGPADGIAEAVGSLGTASAYAYDIHPGRPGAVGSIQGTTVICLPGNPGAALLQARLLALPAVRAMAGLLSEPPARVVLDREVAGRVDRRDFVPMTRTDRGLEIAPGRGSGNLHRLARTDGWIEVPTGIDCLAAGEAAHYWRVDTWMR